MKNSKENNMNDPYAITASEFLKELHETHLHQCKYSFEIEKKGTFEPVAVTFVGKASFHYYDSGIGRNVYENVTAGDCFRLNGTEYVIKQEWNMADSEPEPEDKHKSELKKEDYKPVTPEEFVSVVLGEYLCGVDPIRISMVSAGGKRWVSLDVEPQPPNMLSGILGGDQIDLEVSPGQKYELPPLYKGEFEARKYIIVKPDPEPATGTLTPPKISKEFLKVMGFEQDGLPDQWQLTLPLETGVTTTLSVMPGNGRCDLIQKEHPGNIMPLGKFAESEIKDLITAFTKRGTGYVWFSRSHVIDYDSKIPTPQHLDSFFEELEDWLVKRSMESPKEPEIMIYRNKWGVAAKLTSLWRGWFFENGLSFISKELLERNK
jgi:hypothetical protein